MLFNYKKLNTSKLLEVVKKLSLTYGLLTMSRALVNLRASKIWGVVLILFSLGTICWGQATFTWSGSVNNNWNVSGNWTKAGTSSSTWPGEVPGQTDNAVITVNPAITITGVPNITLNSISIGNRNVTLNSSSGSTITINNTNATVSINVVASRTLTFGGGTAANAVNLVLQTITQPSTIAGTLTIAGNSYIDCGTNIVSGTGSFILSANATLITANTAGITSSGSSGSIQVSGTRTYNTGNYTYNGSSMQSTGNGLPATITNLIINNSAGVTLSQGVTVNGTLTLQNGAFSIGANTLALANASNLSYSGGSLTGSSSSNLTIGTGAAINPLNSISGGLNNLSLSRNVTLGSNISIAGNLTLTGSALDLGSYTANRSSTGGTLSLDATSSLLIGGTNTFPSNYTINTLTSGSTINYYGTNQNVAVQSYSNLTLSGSGSKTLLGTITPTGNLTITGSTFDLGTYTANRSAAGGALSLDATSTLLIGGTNTFPSNYTTNTLTAGSTVNYGGTNQNVAVQSYSRLTLSGSGTKTLQGNITPSGNLTITGSTFDLGSYSANRSAAGGTLSLDATSTLLIGGTNTFPSNYTTNTLTAGSTVNYDGTSQNVAVQSYSNLTLSGSGTKTLLGNITPGGNLTITNSTFDLGIFTSNRSAAGGTLSLDATSTLLIGGTNTFPSNYTINTISSGSTVNYYGSNQSVALQNYSSLVLSGSLTKTFSGAVTISGDLSIEGTAQANLGAFTSSAGTLTLGGYGQSSGSWGGTGSSSTYKNTNYFAAATGIVNVITSSCTSGLWLGGTSTDWNTASNWCGGTVPTASTDVVIPAWANQPVVNATASCNSITVNAGATLTNNSSLTISTSLAGAGSFINASTGTLNIGGAITVTTFTVTAAGNTINYTGTGQTLRVTSYQNLTLSGGAETFGAITTVNGDLTLSGSATATTGANLSIGGNLSVGDGTTLTVGGFALNVTGTTTVGSGASGTLTINNATGLKTFSGAVTINSGGSFTETAAAQLSFGDLTINGTLTESGAAVVGFSGNLTNNGTYTSSTGVHTFSGTSKTLSGISVIAIPRATFTGTYTNNGTFSSATLLTVTGTTLTNNGTITATTSLTGTGGVTQGTSGILTIGGTSTISALTATATGNTVNFNGAAQTVFPTSYSNLTLSNSGAKTTTGVTVNGVLSMEGTATATVTAPTYGGSATLQYNTATSRTVGIEWLNTFAATGGVIIANTGVITMNSAKVFNAGVPLTINAGSALSTSAFNYSLTLGGDFVNNGTLTGGTSSVIIAGAATSQNIGTFTVTGAVSMTKTAGTATFTGNVNGGGLTINGSGGTLNLGAGLIHAFTGNWTMTAGTLNGGSSVLRIGGSYSTTGGSFNAGTGTIEWNAAGAQNIPNLAYYNLLLSNSGTKTFQAALTISGNISVSGTAKATLAGFTSTASTITLGGIGQTSGTWGGTGSGAAHINATYFNAGAGIVNVSSCTSGFWLGGTSTDWNTGSNWCGGTVPVISTDVVILSGGNQPLIGATALSNSIIVDAGATLTNNSTLTIATSLTGAGTYTNAANSTLNVGGAVTVTTFTATAAGNTVNYTGTGQNLRVVNYQNLTLSGGAEAFGAITTISGNLTLSGTATATTGAALSISGNLNIGSGTSFSTGANNGWILGVTGTTTVSGTLTLANTGAKTFTGNVTINSGGVWNESGAATINYAGNLQNDGATFTANTGTHNFSGASKTISGASLIAIPTATFTNAYTNSGTFSSATLLTVTGTTLTNNGTITATTALSGTGGVTQGATGMLYIGGTSGISTLTVNTAGNTVNYNGGAQTVKVTTYSNLTLSGSGSKTIGAVAVNGVLSMEGTATASAAPTYGGSASLQYNTATARTAGPEWLNTFTTTGGVIIANTGTITMNAAKVFNAGVPLTINTGSSLSTNNFSLTLGGDFVNNGTLTGGTSNVIINGTGAQNIGTFTVTGTVSMTKASGTATLTGNVNGNALTINGGGGTLNLGAGLVHTFTGTWTMTAGTLNGGSSVLRLGSNYSSTGGTFSAGTGTIEWNAAGPQSLVSLAYYNLTLGGSGTKTFPSAITISGCFSVNTGVVANLGTFISSANTLRLGGFGQASGSWGSSTSSPSPAHIDDTYFSATTGFINITNGSCQTYMGFSYERNITIDYTKVSGGSDIYNFPVMISLTGQNFLKNVPTGQINSSSGYDIIFTDNNHNKLDHQLEYFNGSTGDLIAWVRIPTLSASSNTVIKIQYGNPQITTDQSVTSVWDSHYKGIWHMDNLSMNDFTSYGKAATPRNSPTIQTGKINNTLALSGANQFATVINAPNTNFAGNLTVSAWIYLTATADQKIAGNQNGTLGGYKFGVFSDNYLEFEIRNSSNTPYLNRGLPGGTLLTNGQWYYVAGISSDVLDSIKTFVNGIPERPYKKSGTLVPSSDSLTIGKEPWLNTNSAFFNGYIDELRISDEFRSNGWMRTEYFNQSSPLTFYSVDASATSLTTLPSASICSVPITFTFGYPAGGTYSGSYVTSGGVFSPPSAGTYTITYTYTGACGPVAASRDIIITPKPAAPSASNQSYCFNQITYLQATSGVNIHWYKNGTLVSTANPFSTGQNTPGTYTYKVTQNVNGCESDSTTVILTISSGASISTQPQATSICNSGSGSFSVVAAGYNLTYQWQEGGVNITDGGIYSGSTTPTLTLTNPGSSKNGLFYRCVITTSCGSPITSNSAALTVTPLPVATFSYTGTPYCQTASNPLPTFSGGGVAGTFSSSSGLVFVSTSTGQVNLLGSTAGNYTVTNTIPASGGCGVVSANSTISVMSNIWIGGTSPDWNTGTNWCTGSVPNGTGYISIPSPASNYPVISSGNIIIYSGATLEIKDGATLTLSSGPILTFQSGSTITTSTTGLIILQSDACYVNLGNSNPKIRAIRQISATVKGWRMMASPVNTAFSDMFATPAVTQGFTGSGYPALQPNLLWWSETDGGTPLQSWRTPVTMGSAITGGQGYFFYIFNGALKPDLSGNYSDALPMTLSATGTEFFNGSGNYNFTITKTARSSGSLTKYIDVAGEGWNLVGNPTASTIDWDAAGGWTRTNLDNSIYIWDPTANSGNGDYRFWNKDSISSTLSSGRITPFQAFWVHANAASPVLSMNNNAKTSTAGTFIKKGSIKNTREETGLQPNIVVPMILEGLGMRASSFISLGKDNRIGLDGGDVYRLQPMNDTWLALYTNSSLSLKEPLVVNSLPLDTSLTLLIPLYTAASVSGVSEGGEMTLSWRIPSNWPSDLIIELMDHNKETALSMTDNNQYKYTLSAVKLKSQSLISVNPLNVPSAIVVSDTILNGSKGAASVTTPFSIIIRKGDPGTKPVYEKLEALLLPLTPNPFRESVKIAFRLPEEANTRIDIYDVYGRLIETLINDRFPAGLTEVTWTPVSSLDGIFIIRLTSGSYASIQRGIKIR